MLSKKSFLIIASIISTVLGSTTSALEYSSYIFTTDDIIFFSYEYGTELELYTSTGQPVSFQPNILDKGEHVRVDRDEINQVYKVCGSNKFSVLTGDPIINGVSGYYAMDANGLGVSTEFYTYVPPNWESGEKFIIFAYEPNTFVTVQKDVGNGNYVNVASFTLNEGQHWANSDLYNKWLHVVSDKPVSALTCHDQGYFVPSSNGRWSGTKFYTYISEIGEWEEDLTVIAHDNGTSIIIRNSDDPNIVIWSGTLNSGEAKVLKCPKYAALDAYYTIESSKVVTVSVQPWVSSTTDYHQGVFIPDRGGTGIGRYGRDIIGSTLNDGFDYDAYLYILAHTDNTHVEIYNSQTGSFQDSYILNKGQAIDANPGNGLWRIVSDRYISAYSGYGHDTAEFAPLAFDAKSSIFYIEKVDVNEPNSVVPGDYITYEIFYGPNWVDHNNVVITDYLPVGVNYIFSEPLADDYNEFTATWNIVSLGAGAPNDSVTLTVKVNEGAEPNGIINNYCEILCDQYFDFAAVDTNVCCWGGDIIYVDESAIYGFNNGTSWENSYLNLQDALARARSGCGSKIWVAAGTYKPIIGGSTRSISFEMIDDVNIYGGFPPGGGPRNPGIYQTILSGDIDDDGDLSNNSYHVVRCEYINNAILDGFTITGGNANASSEPDYFGGGIYIYKSSPTIKNCIFSNNSAIYGGGMFNNNSDPNITNCIFSSNTSSYGGGMYNDDNSSPTVENCVFRNSSTKSAGGGICNHNNSNANIINCIFYENKVTTDGGCGGGISNAYSSPTITNCTFSANYATNYGYGGGMENFQSSPTITNCIFWDNDASIGGYEIYNYDYASHPNFSYCDIKGGLNNPPGCGGYSSIGSDNINKDPCFYDASADNFHLKPDSDCIDEGDPNFNPNPGETDIDGEPRKVDGDSNGTSIVDIGADEYYWSPADFNKDEIVNFIDYAIFTTDWKSNDSEYSLDEDNDVDYNDLALFCEDWLWTPAWDQPMESMMMGDGLGGGMGQGVFLTGFGEKFSTGYTGEVYQPEPVEEEQPEPITQQEIEDTLKWLDEVWLYPEVRESTSEDDWLEFVELVKSSLQ